MADLPTTGRVRRSGGGQPAVNDAVAASRYRHGSIVAAAPQPAVTPAPHGDLTAAAAQTIVGLVGQVWPASVSTVGERRRAVRALLTYLATLPGDTWQQRWDASPYTDGSLPYRGLQTDPGARAGAGFSLLICLRVLRPGLAAMRAVPMAGSYAEAFRVAQADPALDRLYAHLATLPVSRQYWATAAFDVACALTVYGIRLAELTPAAMLHYAWECRSLKIGPYRRGKAATFSGQLAWRALREIGHFPPDTPPTLRAAGQRGRLSVPELVDRYPITNQPVRTLLIDYLQRRAPMLDYSSLDNLARWVAGVFWSKIESMVPGQPDLHIPGHVYDQWRAAINLRDDGRPRLSVDPILLSVRSFYLDLHTWAAAEPQRWGHWVAPCPINPGDFAGSARRHRRVRERAAERTRDRQPLLPVLVAHLADRLARARHLLAAAADLADGQFVIAGRAYTRVRDRSDERHHGDRGRPRVRVRDQTSGQIVNASRAEETGFWDWAIVETLRLTGVRIEELLELTQLSIRRYLRATGETVALLVVAPSKSDRERVIPMSAELLAVIAAIIRRHTEQTGGVPAISRYDTHERVHTPALPFLFQRPRGASRVVFGQSVVLALLQRHCTDLAATHPQFARARFTPHDFRRIFATDLVNNGLPIHIGAALLGHLNLETTRGYVAVFDDDLVRHYQQFLDRRRRMRPAEEYRPASQAEWREFEQHFDKRKVELGNCGRPYGTPCAHEHACLRCPMLHVHPDSLPRLDLIEADLRARRDRAHTEGWLGEIEGIDLTLSHLHNKRQHAQRLQPAGTVALGLPANRTPNAAP